MSKVPGLFDPTQMRLVWAFLELENIIGYIYRVLGEVLCDKRQNEVA